MSRGEAPTVVITGASAGVGRATALAFARRSWNVALLARDPTGLESAGNEVDQAGGRALLIPRMLPMKKRSSQHPSRS
jgi:NADP-dependent 3-hydroxy acid dehydrogenase YdfG